MANKTGTDIEQFASLQLSILLAPYVCYLRNPKSPYTGSVFKGQIFRERLRGECRIPIWRGGDLEQLVPTHLVLSDGPLITPCTAGHSVPVNFSALTE